MTLFWKGVGGYTACVKLKNRWHYVGNSAAELQELHRVLGPLTRVQGIPKAISQHLATIATLKASLPYWRDAL